MEIKLQKKLQSGTGINITGYIRALLNNYVPWKDCEHIGTQVDSFLKDQEWLSLDNGTTFEKTFKV